MMYGSVTRGLILEGLPLEFTWNEAPLDVSVWALLADAPHPKAAAAFLNFYYSSPEAHAAFMTEAGEATAMRAAPALMDSAAAATLPTTPETWPQLVPTDSAWLGEHLEEVQKRWAEWISA